VVNFGDKPHISTSANVYCALAQRSIFRISTSGPLGDSGKDSGWSCGGRITYGDYSTFSAAVFDDRKRPRYPHSQSTNLITSTACIGR
jgi:hypothetical protein